MSRALLERVTAGLPPVAWAPEWSRTVLGVATSDARVAWAAFFAAAAQGGAVAACAADDWFCRRSGDAAVRAAGAMAAATAAIEAHHLIHPPGTVPSCLDFCSRAWIEKYGSARVQSALEVWQSCAGSTVAIYRARREWRIECLENGWYGGTTPHQRRVDAAVAGARDEARRQTAAPLPDATVGDADVAARHAELVRAVDAYHEQYTADRDAAVYAATSRYIQAAGVAAARGAR